MAFFIEGVTIALAVKLMIDQGIDVTAVHFTSVFCNCSPKKAGCKMHARQVADEFRVPIQTLHKGMDHMKMVENPPHGRGSATNACIDCRIYMLRRVKEIMPELGASFVITGEVLGQRPMSQQRHTINLIEKESGLQSLILRPLSAQHFPPTLPEREGVVDREKLLNISGRGRKEQFALAENLGIKDYPCPAGGCLLTDKVVASRLSDLFDHTAEYSHNDLVLLTLGGHYRLSPWVKIILGRNKEENRRLDALAEDGQSVFQPHNFRGPTVIAKGCLSQDDEKTISAMIASFSKDEHVVYYVKKTIGPGNAVTLFETQKLPRDTWENLRLGFREKNSMLSKTSGSTGVVEA